jgi:hypothetical protein
MCQRGKEWMVWAESQSAGRRHVSDTGGIPKKERGPAFDIEERNLKLEAKKAC